MPIEANFNPNDPALLDFLKQIPLLQCLDETELNSFTSLLQLFSYNSGEPVYKVGSMRDTIYFVHEGRLSFEKSGYIIRFFDQQDVFGDYSLINNSPHSSTIHATEPTELLEVRLADLQDESKFTSGAYGKLCKQFAYLLTTRRRHEEEMYSEIDVLVVQDGGCAPGYNSVTAFLTEFLEKSGRRVFAASEGFRSLVSGDLRDFRRVVYSGSLYRLIEDFHGVVFTPPLREARGADFRSERYPDFKELENQKRAAENIKKRKVKAIIGIGGDGTLAGMQSLGELLPDEIQMFFVPVTIDSDIYGTDCIGQYTGVEVGAEKIRCYMADARTHGRCYIIEMMGREGGYHALHSCLGAGAHLAVLPDSRYNMKRVAKAIENRHATVIVVAEGYRAKERKSNNLKESAAEYFYKELLDAGLNTAQRVVCEAFSRDIRGALPNNTDITLAQRMAKKLTFLMQTGQTKMMPAVLSGQEYAIPFDDIRTHNTVSSDLAVLANRLGV
ncbi:cyclic nucleotide-binding protein [Chloroherpeton thalassium ATCC 35110]|uniref:6-phosphofructokinase n=1 Tax=Chloroherpeton thalassium (strain ATCC 35110 / GB-78) TaxID=517418 RepID=B3QRP9_CHLT3|nr:6-phosphofructokinase [Chloroherpeton thalassium]ACF13852.1 cyclic nucleotide-binding protein [Chloroherpeton thalassium ATCC 35110]